MKTKEELKDIIDCIVKFDDKESLKIKGHYFNVIQKDLRKLVKREDYENQRQVHQERH